MTAPLIVILAWGVMSFLCWWIDSLQSRIEALERDRDRAGQEPQP